MFPAGFRRAPARPCGARSEWTCLPSHRASGGAPENDAGLGDYLDKLKNGADVIPILRRLTVLRMTWQTGRRVIGANPARVLRGNNLPQHLGPARRNCKQ